MPRTWSWLAGGRAVLGRPTAPRTCALLHELSVDYALPTIFARDAFGLTFVSSSCSSPRSTARRLCTRTGLPSHKEGTLL